MIYNPYLKPISVLILFSIILPVFEFTRAIIIYIMSRSRQLSHRSPALSTSAHIIQEHLDRKGQLIERYRNSTQDQIQKIDNKQSRNINYTEEVGTVRKNANRQKLRSHRKQPVPHLETLSTDNINDYQKLILGMEYNLQVERKKREALQNKNVSLQTEISNLRNLLVGPDEQKHYEKTAFKEYQEKISTLQAKIIQQKQNYEFIIDSKNQALASLEFELRTLEKKMREQEKDSGVSRKMLQLMAQIEELRVAVAKKNIIIEKIKFHGINDDSDSDEQAIKKVSKKNKIEYYFEQVEISNKLILRKNIEILNSNKKILKYEQVLDVIEHYLDKKQVKNVDLNVLQHACVNKLRLLLREKAVFERQLLGQLNEHNKKISNFQQEIIQRDSVNGNKIIQVVNDNKRLSALVSTLQNTIKNLQLSLDGERREGDILRNQIQINKKQFVEQVKKLKDELNTISNVTKNQFDRMKLENIKLSEQNKSLLFLVGEKEKEIYKKGQSIKVFEQYKDKINNLNVDATQKRKIDATAEDNPQIGTKLVLINTFSQWMIQWNKIRNWNNKKVLLNIILDKQQIRTDSLNSMTYLINILHEALLNSKNIQIQQRTIILLSYYLKQNILKNINFYVDKIAPIVVRGFRAIIEGEDEEKHRMLNEAALKIISSMQRNEFKWSPEMTNEMLSINGLKYLFNIVNNSKVDQLVQCAYNCLIMIAKQNEMISFMNSFNIATILIKNVVPDYHFLIHALYLLKTLLQSRDFIKSQKSLLQFRKINSIIKESEDEETINLTLDCALILMDNSLYVKSLNKIQIMSILNQALRNHSDYHILKKIGQIYGILLAQLQTENMSKLNKQLGKLLDIVKTKKFNENRFNRAIRIVLKFVQIITDNPQIDEQILSCLTKLYSYYDSIDTKTKVKINMIINIIYDRNKELINKFSNQDWIISIIQAYKLSNSNQEIIFLLKILQFQNDQKKTTEIMRSGRESLINKLINDALIPDYNVAIAALKNLLSLSKEKYAEKFVNKAQFTKIMNKILTSRNEQEYIGTVISILYYFCKNEDASVIIIQLDLVQKIFKIITQRHDKQNLIYKCLTLLQLCHTTNYKRKILNYLLSNDSNLQILKTMNFVLKKAKNKQEMGSRAVFIYDFLNGKTAVQSLALLIQQNTWMVQDLIDVRNQYVSKVDPLVYKIQLLLHNMSTVNPTVRKIYEKFKIQGDYDSDDDK